MSSEQHHWMGRVPTTEMERRQAAAEEGYAREDEWLRRARFEEAPNTGEQTMGEPNIATMNSEELKQHIGVLDARHRKLLAALRALLKARIAEEAVAGKGEEE